MPYLFQTETKSRSNLWTNLISIIYEWPSNKYKGTDSSVSWWYKYSNQGWELWHAKSENKQNYVGVLMWFIADGLLINTKKHTAVLFHSSC